MNVTQMRVKTLQVMREYSNNGQVTTQGDNLDYLLSMNNFFDMAQKELAQSKPINKVYQFSNYPSINGLGMYGFDLKRHSIQDEESQPVVANAYYFETDGASTVLVKELESGVWQTLYTLNNTVKGQFTAFKGLITPTTPGNQIKLVFSGDYAYSFRNVALFTEKFETISDVPDYVPYREIDMPTDFYRLDKIFFSTDSRQFNEYVGYKYTPNKKLRINYYEKGEFMVYYHAYPSDIPTSGTDLTVGADYEFEIDVEAQELIPLRAAYYALRDEPKLDLSALLNEYFIGVNNLSAIDGQYNEAIQSIYTMG